MQGLGDFVMNRNQPVFLTFAFADKKKGAAVGIGAKVRAIQVAEFRDADT